MDWTELINLPVYDLPQAKKSVLFDKELSALSQHHYRHCRDYKKIIDSLYPNALSNLEQPSLAVRLFKHHFLSSVSENDIYKITTSSGTTSQQVSKIVLDKENIARQQKVLAKIVQQWLGKKRLPMLIVDHPNVIKDKFSYSARGVGIQGMSLFGHHHTYALNEDMSLNIEAIKAFEEKYQHEEVFVFGFTFMIWQHFILALEKQNLRVNFPHAKVFHSGGWKKLQDQAVSNDEFKQRLSSVSAAVNVHNFYGMVEQTGTIYVECEAGYLHAPVWSDIKIKRFIDLSPAAIGEKGIVQVNSLLPSSYPGHSLLTEDTGTIMGFDTCTCGKKGLYFSIHGRLAAAEVRGCSDTQT